MKMKHVLSLTAVCAASLLAGNVSAAVIAPIAGDVKDQELYAVPSHKFIGQSTARVGLGGPSAANAQLVIPFALPALASGESITDATLSFNITAISSFNSTDLADLNLYGIRSNASATPVDTDFIDDVTSLPTGVSLLEASVATLAGGAGAKSSSADVAIGTWLQSLYDNGAVAGDFAFLGLALANPGATQPSRYYTLTTSDGASDVPTLSITTAAVPEPASLALIGVGSLVLLRRKMR